MTGSYQTTLYNPQGELKTLVEHLDRIPHYVFRTRAPKTNGTTTVTLVQSAAATNCHSITDILSRPTDEAAKMLENHCLWKDLGNDNLTSWTSSFLFAIQLAIYRRFNDYEKPSPLSIQVHVLDTRKLPRGTFMSAVPLLQAYNINHPKLIHGYRYDEYLSQGSIVIPDGAMATTTYQSLINAGLHKLYPAFTEEEYHCKLRKCVLQRRNVFNDDPKTPTKGDLSIAETIANRWCSSDEMRPVIMTTLLSLEPRYRNEPAILKAFEVNGWGSYVRNDKLDSFNTSSSEFVHEHRQFVEMMYDVHADAQRQRQLKRAGLLVEATSEVTEKLSQVNLSPLQRSQTPPTAGLTLNFKVASNYYNLGPKANLIDSSTDPLIKLPKRRITRTVRRVNIEYPGNEEDKSRALEQVSKYASNGEQCHGCHEPISPACLHKRCFTWCNAHNNMVDRMGICSGCKKAVVKVCCYVSA